MSTAATKSVAPSIAEIRENTGTSSSIQEAVRRLLAARTAATNELLDLEQDRPKSLLHSSAAEIDRNDVKARQLRIFVEQMDTLEPELKKALVSAREVEERSDYDAELAAVGADIAAWNADMLAQYDSAIAPLIALLQREQEIRRKCEAVMTMPAYHRLCTSYFRPPHPRDGLTQAASAVDAYDGKRISFAELVRLPRLDGGDNSWPRL